MCNLFGPSLMLLQIFNWQHFLLLVPVSPPTTPPNVTTPPPSSPDTINVALPPVDQIDTGEL